MSAATSSTGAPAGRKTPVRRRASETRTRAATERTAGDRTGHDELFNDGKDADALRTIGEVAKALGLRQHVLRYWEEQFPTLTPLTRAGGRRYYRSEDIALLIEIDRLLNREGYTIRGARQALGRRPSRVRSAAASEAPDTEPEALPSLESLAVEPMTEAVAEPQATADHPVGSDAEQVIVEALLLLRGHLEGVRSRLSTAISED